MGTSLRERNRQVAGSIPTVLTNPQTTSKTKVRTEETKYRIRRKKYEEECDIKSVVESPCKIRLTGLRQGKRFFPVVSLLYKATRVVTFLC